MDRITKSFVVAALSAFLSGCVLPLPLPRWGDKAIVKDLAPVCNKFLSTKRLFQKSVGSVVVVRVKKSQGSGFVVEHDQQSTYVLTNAHVVGAHETVSVKWADNVETSGKVIGNLGGASFSTDMALIRLDKRNVPAVSFARSSAEIGENVVVIGSPSGLEFTVTKGVVSQLRDKGDFVQIDAAINPGNSGGPVFDESGCVLGMATFKLGKNTQGLNFAISNKLIHPFLSDPKYDRKITEDVAIASLPPVPKYKSGPFKEPDSHPFFPQKFDNSGLLTIALIDAPSVSSDGYKFSFPRVMLDKSSLAKDGDYVAVRVVTGGARFGSLREDEKLVNYKVNCADKALLYRHMVPGVLTTPWIFHRVYDNGMVLSSPDRSAVLAGELSLTPRKISSFQSMKAVFDFVCS